MIPHPPGLDPPGRPALVLQERDLEFLRAAEEYRLLTTAQYLLLFSTESRAAIYRRLQALYHYGYLDRTAGAPRVPLVYTLSPRGAEVLAQRGFRKEVPDLSKKNPAIATLVSRVGSNPRLHPGQKNSLTTKLFQALLSLAGGKPAAVVNQQLDAFIQEVNALKRGDELDARTADSWIALAIAIMGEI